MIAVSVSYTHLDVYKRQDWITLNLPPTVEDAFILKKETGIPVLWYDDLKFIPMFAAHNIPYHTYFKINLL